MPLVLSPYWTQIVGKPTTCAGFGLTGADLATTIGANAVQNASNAVAKDCGHGNVGSFVFALGGGTTFTAGTTYAGNVLNSSGASLTAGAVLSGTWRALGTTGANGSATLLQRIA